MKHKTVRLLSGIIICFCGLVAVSAQNLVQVNGEIPSLAERNASIPGLAPAKRPAPPAQMTIKRFSRPGPTAKARARLAENTKLAAARSDKEVPESYIVMMEDGIFPYAYREANGEEHLVDPAGLTLAETATKLVGELGGDLVHIYTFGGGGFSANLTKEQAEELRRLPGIKQVTPDRIMDTYAAPSWGQDRINQRAFPLDGNVAYKTPGGSTVHVYVIDTGVRGTHQEFAGRIGNGFSSLGLNPYEDKDSFANPDPTLPPIISGHGTSVAGTATGAAFGIATTSIVHSVRVSDDSGIMPESTVVAGVDWVRLNRTNPAVVNMSIGGPEAGLNQGILSPTTLAVKALIASGVTVVAAAGNDNINADFFTPARIPEAITVGASDQLDSKASFSNIGQLIDIFAPGVAIEAAFHLSDTSLNTRNGTSFAAPHVAGVVALYLAGHPGATPEEVRQNIVANATRDIIVNAPTDTTNELLYAKNEWLDADRIIVGGSGALAGLNIVHPNGNVYDQVLMTGSTVTVHPDWNQVVRCSWIDENDDIVMAEYAGMGNLKITLENFSGPAFPVKYNQAVQYMKGRAKFEIIAGGSNTFFSTFSVGRANAVDQSIFLSVAYDGKADIKSLSFLDTDKIAAVLTGNGIYRGDTGIVGINGESFPSNVEKVKITNRLVLRDIKAGGSAEARLLLSSDAAVPQFTDFGGRPVIAGGDLVQPNGSRIAIRLLAPAAGFSALVTNANVDSHGNTTPPLPLNNARFGKNLPTATTDVLSYSTLDSLGFPPPPSGTTSPF